jgi:SAM-dependent methyltransferase
VLGARLIRALAPIYHCTAVTPWSRSLAEIDHYPGDRAVTYQHNHECKLRSRLTTARERACLARALQDAGSPVRVLDLACGAGRFWPTFAQAGVGEVVAADASSGMLAQAAQNRRSPTIPSRLMQCSAFALPFEDGEVDFISCMRFFHHLSVAEDRSRFLAEVARVTRRHVALSLWVDGSYASLRRARRSPRTVRPGYGGRICRSSTAIEADFAAAGLQVVRHYDVWPRISMWRVYLLATDA